MAITTLPARSDASAASIHAASKSKIIFITLLFLLSLLSFITQTEFTSQAYQHGYKEPLVLLLVTHGSWWLLWPIQAFAVSVWRTTRKLKQNIAQDKRFNGESSIDNNEQPMSSVQFQRLSSNTQLLESQTPSSGGLSIPSKKINYYIYFKKCIVKQIHNVYHTSILVYETNVNDDRSTYNVNDLIDLNPRLSNSSSITSCIKSLILTPSFKYILIKTLLISIVLTIAGTSWYAAMSMTYASDVTAIYNCSAFTAYAFAIPLLNEKFSWLKASSVVIAISGVFIVAYSGESTTTEEKAGNGDNSELYPHRFWGNLIIFIGAILYGYYEVIYKKYTCIPEHLAKIITPRRQLTFANFIMALLGVFTCLILLSVIIFAQIFHIHDFNLFDYGEDTGIIWTYIGGSIVSNLLFSGSFLSLMALTSPVLSSVSSLLSIFLIGVVEWVFFGNKLSLQQLTGDVFVIIGFSLLTAASWKEISEGNEDDDVETVSTLSFAISTDGQDS